MARGVCLVSGCVVQVMGDWGQLEQNKVHCCVVQWASTGKDMEHSQLLKWIIFKFTSYSIALLTMYIS